MLNNTKLIITGGVGVGKSTTIDKICSRLKEIGIKYHIVPEYIDGDINGPCMLDKFIDHTITSYEFQDYILDYFDDYLSKMKTQDDEVLVFERLPDDSVSCFANIALKNNELSMEEFRKLFNKCVYLDKKYNLPSYFTNFSKNVILIRKTYRTDDNIEEILHTLQNSIHEKKNILVGLWNDDIECLNRIHHRNRESEVKAYTIDVVKRFNTYYNKIYEKLQIDGNVDFETLPTLIV